MASPKHRYIGERSGTDGLNELHEQVVINTTNMNMDTTGLTMAADAVANKDPMLHGRGGGGDSIGGSTITLRALKFTGVRDGVGRYLFKDGSYYNGQWANDQMSGFGRYDMANGDCYVGEFHKNRRDGHGMCTYADGSTYDGGWLKNMRHGEGVQWFNGGDKFEGEWVDDQMHGSGSYVWADGVKYKGEYQCNLRHGIGKCDYLDGSINQGQWEHGEFLGKKFKPDYEYTGEYNMTLGSYLYATKTGFGTKVWKDGTRRSYKGEWYQDRMAGMCQAMSNFDGPGTVYSGQLLAAGDGVKHGQGTFTAANGDVYVGQWDHGKRHGHGQLTYAKTGEVYTGKWYNDRSMRRGGP